MSNPLTFYQGDTFRATLAITRVLPATPPLNVATNENVVTLSGAGGSGMTLELSVTTESGAVIPFSIEIGDGWSLDEIQGVAASRISWDGGGDPTQAFGAQTVSSVSFSIGTTELVTSIAATITQSNFYDMTGASATMMIRKSYGSAAPLLTLTTNDALVIDPVSGTVSFTLTAAQTAALPLSYANAPVSSSGSSQYSSGSVATLASQATPPSDAIFLFDIKISLDDQDVGHIPEQSLTMKAVLTRP